MKVGEFMTRNNRRFFIVELIIWIGLIFSSIAVGAEKAQSLGSGDLQKPLEVKGQTRNITMMVVNQAEKEKLKFVTARKDFREQILNTKY